MNGLRSWKERSRNSTTPCLPENHGYPSISGKLRGSEHERCAAGGADRLPDAQPGLPATPEKRSGYLKEAADAQGIEICQDEDLISITLPGLLPKRKQHVNTAFLHEPLNYALQTYLAVHSLPLYRECVVCFSQSMTGTVLLTGYGIMITWSSSSSWIRLPPISWWMTAGCTVTPTIPRSWAIQTIR